MSRNGNFRTSALLAGLAAPSMLGGCTELSTIYHNRGVPSAPRVITTDAYQRNVIFANREDGLRICSEAAPDTFAAMNASLAASGDVVKKQASIAAAISQSGATIERTQTVNLLREMMYRTCERYLNGGISKETLVVQAARDQRQVMTTLAIEQLTKTALPASTVLSAGPTSTIVPNDALIDMIDAFRKERDTAQGALKEAKDAFVAADKTGKCVATAAEPADDTGDPTKTDWDKCDSARATATAREAELKLATDRLDQALKVTGGNGGAISASTGQGPNHPSGGSGALSDASIQAVASAIVTIVKDPGLDEALMFCVGYLSTSPAAVSRNDQTTDTCRDIVTKRAAHDEAIRADNVRIVQGDLQLGAARSTLHDPGADSGLMLLAYLDAATDTKERARRRALVRKAADALGLPSGAVAVTILLNTGKASDTAALLNAVRALETTKNGKADLAAPSL